MRRLDSCSVVLFVLLGGLVGDASHAAEPPFVFRDVAQETNLRGPLAGMMAHAATWGDVNGDGRLDLFVGTFADRPAGDYIAGGATGPVPNQLFSNRKVMYYAPGPSADFDNDGRLDLLMASGFPKSPTLLLRNESPSGHFLDVEIEGAAGISRMGIDAVVRAYRAGHSGDLKPLLASEELATGYGYCSGQPAVAHLGLAAETTCDLLVTLPHGKGRIARHAVKADQRLRLRTRWE